MSEPAFQEDPILIAIRGGNEMAFSTLFKECYQQLCYFTDKIVRDKEEAQTIASDVLGKLWFLRQNFDKIRDVKAFLFTSCYYKAIDVRRSRATNKGKSQSLTDDMDALSDKAIEENSHNEILIKEMIIAEVLKCIFDAMDQLPHQQKRVLMLCYIEGKKNIEVAEIMGLTHQTVRNTKLNAIRSLKGIISAHGVFLDWIQGP